MELSEIGDPEEEEEEDEGEEEKEEDEGEEEEKQKLEFERSFTSQRSETSSSSSWWATKLDDNRLKRRIDFSTFQVTDQKQVDKTGIKETFTFFERRLLICIIDECINKLVIVGASKEQYAATINFSNAANRYKERKKITLYEKVRNQSISKNPRKIREMKFQKDRELIIKILSLIREELIENYDLAVIFAYLTAENECNVEDRYISESYKGNKAKVKELKWLKETVKMETATFVREQEKRLKEKRNDIDKMKRIYECEMIYSTRWHQARYDQNNLMIQRRERKIKEELDLINNKLEKETRVNKEINKYLDFFKQQNLADIEHWTKLYDKDITRLDTLISKLETNIDEGNARLEILTTEMKLKGEEIVILKAEKRERDAFIATEKLREESALKIQSWWRGIMVRWELGGYDDIMKRKFKRKRGKK